jgi:bifunctional non-homologous end joining protein LigD
LLVGHYGDGKLHYAGKVGTGFSQKLGRELIAKLEKHGRKDSPFVDVPRADARDARWVDPVLVAEIEFTSWTRDRHLRHPSFKDLREDKPAGQVRAERGEAPMIWATEAHGRRRRLLGVHSTSFLPSSGS